MPVRPRAAASTACVALLALLASAPSCSLSSGGTAGDAAGDGGGASGSHAGGAPGDAADHDGGGHGDGSSQGSTSDSGAGTGGDAGTSDAASGDGGISPAAIRVTLLTLDTRQYVSAAGGGGGAVTAASATAGADETFAITDASHATLTDGDTIELAASDGDYLSAAGGGGGALTAGATTAGTDETFTLHRIAGPGAISTGDLVALETTGTPSYVSATNGGGSDVQANAPWAHGWESFWITIAGQAAPIPAAKQKVLAYLQSIQGKKTVAGQHDKNNPTPTDATDQVTSITGKAPGLWSGDFLFGDDEVAARPTMIAEAQAQWAKGAIVQLMYHACIPTGDESCSWDDIGGATPQHLTDAQWSNLVTDGGTLNQAWKARLDTLSVFLAELQAAGVAPLFRPHHEMNQPVFWWAGRPGATGTSRLFQITHDYLVGNKGFTNIVWVWDLQDFSTLTGDVVDYSPGADYFDIAALDYYDGGYVASEYTTMQTAAAGKLMAIGECSTLPTATELAQQPGWAFFMLWPDFIAQDQSTLPALYGASNVVTMGGMPGW